MDILVCGAQAPFMTGGAELGLDNLVGALRAAGHRAELVRLPTAWDRTRIFDAAMAWRLVPLDADLVIATNFPSYFARHPRKVVWLFHQHRAAYDGAGTAWSDFGDDPDSLEAQRLLAEWDRVALSEAASVFSISARVAERLTHHNGLSATPLYHPAPLHDRIRSGPFGDHLFCPTRLEQNKRPGLAVDAAAHLDSGLEVRIAGRGSLHDELAARTRAAGTDDRVRLLGFVSDDDLIDQLATSLGVIYTPFDEDYGYVTLQAFRAGKPVITSADSGGVLEWVEDGVNGFVTDGSPEAIADAGNRLAADRGLAERMGEAGRARVAGLSWSAVVDTLLGGR
ncbi:MAG TPA: glycosyltransferase family 4 protein [Acidimicrobiales bacterium]|nr:glycosyltransferase family 4 protein [Acidimicrobiales bacterium]